MAARLGVSRARVQGIESTPRPSAAVVKRWCDALAELSRLRDER